MLDNANAWQFYADLQRRSENAPLTDSGWGLERGLDYVISAIETGTVPPNSPDFEAAIERAIRSGARLHRSRSMALKTRTHPSESMSTEAAAMARVELAMIGRTVKRTDERILLDAGFGYTDREIADRYHSTPGAIRVRLSRLRLKLETSGHF